LARRRFDTLYERDGFADHHTGTLMNTSFFGDTATGRHEATMLDLPQERFRLVKERSGD
jgi:hypothetical protein